MQPVVTASARADLGWSTLAFYGVITDAIGQPSAALAAAPFTRRWPRLIRGKNSEQNNHLGPTIIGECTICFMVP
jgi:hypothetical protein